MKPDPLYPTLGFTGTRQCPTDRGVAILERNKAVMSECKQFVTGGAVGWDAIAGLWCFLNFSRALHRVILPTNMSQVDRWWASPLIRPQVHQALSDGRLIIDLPDPSEERTYRDRNRMIVGQADELFAVADYPEQDGRSKRSGTWQTVRMARRESIPIRGEVLHS